MTKEQAKEQLENMTAGIEDLIKARFAFIEEHRYLFAEFQIGEKVYNLQEKTVDTVTKHYTTVETSLYPHCIIQRGDTNIFDNTSRWSWDHPWVKLEDYENKTPEYVSRLESFAGQRKR